jgi:small-conductance mechanosensitive channel
MLPEKAVLVRNALVRVVVLVQAAVWVNAFIGFWAQRHRERNLEKDKASVTTMNAAAFLLRVALFSVVLVLALDNAGFEVSALLASLGVAGIAVALAVQTIVADIFASLSISLDKPFVIGDFIIVDKHLGVVEYVGLKTTRIRSLWGEQLVFSNNDLLNARIQNYGKMTERRVAFTFGVLYQTTHEQLEAIPPMVREVIEGIELTRFDRAHFFKFGESSYDFEVVYYIGSADYNLYMDIQQAINLGIVRGFADRGIEFAYPTRTVYVQGAEDPAEVTGGGPPATG